MVLPYAEPLTTIQPGERVVPEPPRRGEAGGAPCGICQGGSTGAVWGDEHWTLHPPVGGSLPGTVWLASREHVDSFKDLSPEALAAFGDIAARIERAILRRALPRLVHAAPTGDARGQELHAPLVGGRAAECDR